MKRTLTFIMALGLLTCGMPAKSEAGLLEFFFPSLKTQGPDPSQTLQAPFAYDPQKPAAPPTETILPVPANLVPLDQPHTNAPNLSNWLMPAMADLLTLDASYEKAITDDAAYFSTSGLQQYRDYLTQNNIIATLQTGRYKITSVVTDAPKLLNQGVVEGRYRWLFEVPVMITYMDSNARSYKKIKPVTQKQILILQLGRMDKATDTQSVQIERWTGKTTGKTATPAKN